VVECLEQGSCFGGAQFVEQVTDSDLIPALSNV
jgi:hypothetical protein